MGANSVSADTEMPRGWCLLALTVEAGATVVCEVRVHGSWFVAGYGRSHDYATTTAILQFPKA